MKFKGRCEYGHIRYEKTRSLLVVLLTIALGLAVFALGLLLNKGDKKNIFSVIAMLFVIPMSLRLVRLIVLLPFHTPNRDIYERVQASLGPEDLLFSDFVFTNGQNAFGLSFLALCGSNLYGFFEISKDKKGKEKAAKAQFYFKDTFQRRGMQIKQCCICTEEKDFLKKIKECDKTPLAEEDKKAVREFLISLAV